jgi:hypothetical protein
MRASSQAWTRRIGDIWRIAAQEVRPFELGAKDQIGIPSKLYWLRRAGGNGLDGIAGDRSIEIKHGAIEQIGDE